MRWIVQLIVVAAVATGCISTDTDGLAETATDAAVAYADGSFGLVTAGVWNESGSEALDVYVGDGKCAAVLVHFEPNTFSTVVVLASLDHFTIAEVLEAHSHGSTYDVEAVADLVGDRRWVPTFDVLFSGPDASLAPYREETAVLDSSCETVDQP